MFLALVYEAVHHLFAAQWFRQNVPYKQEDKELYVDTCLNFWNLTHDRMKQPKSESYGHRWETKTIYAYETCTKNPL